MVHFQTQDIIATKTSHGYSNASSRLHFTLLISLTTLPLSSSFSSIFSLTNNPAKLAFHHHHSHISQRKWHNPSSLFSTPPNNDGIDPNLWSSDSEDEEDWQETLKKQQEASWGSEFEPSSETTGPTAEVEDDGTESWLDALQAISADEVSFMNKEADRADKARQMQEMGYTTEQVEATFGLAMDDSKEKDEDNEIFQKFQDATKETGFGMVVDDDIDLSTVESHTTVEVDEETGDPIRSQMVYVDEHSCIGCTNCAMIAQSTFYMNDEHGRARVFQQWGDDDETIKIAIETCPVDCIHYIPYDELVRLEVERRDQNINFKARLVSQAEYGGGQSQNVGGPSVFTAPQKISGNLGSRCRNCPSAGCFNCPMYGVGKNPEFERKEKLRQERRTKKLMKEQMENANKSADL